MDNTDKHGVIEITSKIPEEFEAEGNQTNVSFKTFARVLATASVYSSANPWTAEDVDKFDADSVTKNYREIVKSSRFFYRRDPLASSVINKLVDIGISDLVLIKGKTSETEFVAYESILPDLQEFAESCALEYLLSGLVIPDINFELITKKEIETRGIKYKNSLQLPLDLGIRDPETIIINSPMIGNKISYFVEIPPELIAFVNSKGIYPDGTPDIELYKEIAKQYPKLIVAINTGETKLKLEEPITIRRRNLQDSPYPTPYLYPALESLRHKRNLRRMDYSIAARVISAIQHVTVGDKDFPLTEEDDVQLDELRRQMRWTNSNNRDIDRIFQLFTNHTVKIDWVFPDTEALLAEGKYGSVNADIIYALGIPRILITGESERSQSSDADVALISPAKTLEAIRRKLINLFRYIIYTVHEKNKFKSAIPEIEFKAMRLNDFKSFLEGLQFLYQSGNISRTTVNKEFGYDFDVELDKRVAEQKALDKSGIPEFAPQPHSNTPNNTNNNTNTDNTNDNDEDDNNTNN